MTKFDGLINRVKIAARYKVKMNELLTGADYSIVVSSIDNLENSVASEKAKVRKDIQCMEEQIIALEEKVTKLQYDNYSEEEEFDG